MSQSGFRREHWTNDSRVWGWTLPLSREKKHCLSHDFYFFLGTTTREAGHKRISLFSSHDFDWTRSPFLSINCWKWTKAINWCLFTVLFYPKRGIWQTRFWSHSHSPFGKAIAKTDGLKKPSPLESELESDSKECTHPRRSTFDVNPRFEISLRTKYYILPPSRSWWEEANQVPSFQRFRICLLLSMSPKRLLYIYIYRTLEWTEPKKLLFTAFSSLLVVILIHARCGLSVERIDCQFPIPLHSMPFLKCKIFHFFFLELLVV